MSNLFYLVIIVFLFIFVVFLLWLVIFKKQSFIKLKNQEGQSLLIIQNQIQAINQTLNDRLGESRQAMQHQFNQSANIIQQVTEKLTRLDKTNQQVVNFANQLKNLQDIFKSPKQRGIVGEYYLETLLKNSLPPNSYKMQYQFPDGMIVDAAIFFGEKIIPIDSKFSLENYNRIIEEKNSQQREKLEKNFINDLKNRINEVSKYVKPEIGTTDIAFMFIPAEAIFYDLLVNQVGVLKGNTRDLIDYAYQKKVVIVSPTTFAAYLQVLFQALRAFRVQESTKEIIKEAEKLGRHLINYEDYLKKIGTHLQTLLNVYQSTYNEFNKINKDILKITQSNL